MTRVPAVVLPALALGAALSGAQQPHFRTGTHTVEIYATALDRGGRLVADLSRDEFEVYDEGRRQELTVFANDVQPITVVVMLDRSGSVEGHFDLVRDAAAEFVANLLPADKARIGSFSFQVLIEPSTFTADRQELLGILHSRLQAAGPTPLWTATSAAMDALADQFGRRVVLIFTDGHDSAPKTDVQISFAEVRDRSEAEGIMVYGIGLAQECANPAPRRVGGTTGLSFQRGGLGGGQRWPIPGRGGPTGTPRGRPPILIPRPPPILLPPPEPPWPQPPYIPPTRWSPCSDGRKPDPNLRRLTEVGGGGYFELGSTADLKSTFAKVADELHRQYLLGFSPASLDGRLHRLEVRALRPNVEVRARTSYVASRK